MLFCVNDQGAEELPYPNAPAPTYVVKISIDPFEERESYFQDVTMQAYAR